MIIREIKNNEISFLKEMLYLALYVPEGQTPFPKTVLENPEISKYIDNWGIYQDDIAIVAEFGGELVGAIWGRIFKIPTIGYGFVDENTPEISMAIKGNFRSQGIGTKLIEEISNSYLNRGINSISLSVDKRNRAKLLYERTGFEFAKDTGTAVIMKKKLK